MAKRRVGEIAPREIRERLERRRKELGGVSELAREMGTAHEETILRLLVGEQVYSATILGAEIYLERLGR